VHSKVVRVVTTKWCIWLPLSGACGYHQVVHMVTTKWCMWLPPSFKTLNRMHAWICFQTTITRAGFVIVDVVGALVSPLTVVWC